VILASAVGTLIEWYDFFVYGSLATTLASQFYRTGTPAGDLIVWLGTYAVGFIVRPFGALVFGYFGDVIGRKYTFMLTLIIMGACTFLVGCLPTYDNIGVTAGIILIFLRIAQGLAIGGEYGGAATYIAEHAPQGKRGFYTSFIQVTATLGMFASLAVILIFSVAMGADNFKSYGWRFPFLFSIFLIAGSIYIRLKLKESPMFQDKKNAGTLAKNPLKESFGNMYNLKYVALSLFGATMGQGVVWYTGQFYALYFIQTVLKTPLNASYLIVGAALLLASPLFILVGWLSDKYGRKPFMMAGIFLAIATWYPIFVAMHHFRPFVDNKSIPNVNYSPVMLSFLVFIMVGYVALAYGPIAAFLVELFPTRIRYTSMSLPYHIGNGVFGGLVPLIGVSVQTASGNLYGGIWYPLGIAAICLVVMIFFIPETYQVDIETMEHPDQTIDKTKA